MRWGASAGVVCCRFRRDSVPLCEPSPDCRPGFSHSANSRRGRDSCRSILATNSNRAGIVLRIMNREGRQENPEREEKHGSAFPLETVFSFAIDSHGFGYF